PVALQLVQDLHIEVRQVAELALRSMLTGQPHLVDRVLSASETWATSDDAFHASTLVLSAIVLSCAYTVPPYVPPVLMKLASIASSKKSSAH
ncbi:DUF3437 domain-containing protein, partial [Vibrio cholerae]|nr:DUF3437 domain-containing protein [Vibrio cholerae]